MIDTKKYFKESGIIQSWCKKRELSIDAQLVLECIDDMDVNTDLLDINIENLEDARKLIRSGRGLDIPIKSKNLEFINILDFIIAKGKLNKDYWDLRSFPLSRKDKSGADTIYSQNEAFQLLDLLRGRRFHRSKLVSYIYESVPYDKLLQICELIGILPSDVYRFINKSIIPKMKPLHNQYYRCDTIIIFQ